MAPSAIMMGIVEILLYCPKVTPSRLCCLGFTLFWGPSKCPPESTAAVSRSCVCDTSWLHVYFILLSLKPVDSSPQGLGCLLPSGSCLYWALHHSEAIQATNQSAFYEPQSKDATTAPSKYPHCKHTCTSTAMAVQQLSRIKRACAPQN